MATMVALKTDVSILSVSSCQWDTYIEPMPKANDNAIFFRLFIWRWNRTTAGYRARYKSVNADKAGQCQPGVLGINAVYLPPAKMAKLTRT